MEAKKNKLQKTQWIGILILTIACLIVNYSSSYEIFSLPLFAPALILIANRERVSRQVSEIYNFRVIKNIKNIKLIKLFRKFQDNLYRIKNVHFRAAAATATFGVAVLVAVYFAIALIIFVVLFAAALGSSSRAISGGIDRRPTIVFSDSRIVVFELRKCLGGWGVTFGPIGGSENYYTEVGFGTTGFSSNGYSAKVYWGD